MRCIGTLEFVSDFHNKCHQTQRELLLDKQRSQESAKIEVKTDFESDKENASPPSNMEVKKNGKRISAQPRRKISRIENKLAQLKKIEYKGGIFDENINRGSENVEDSQVNGASVCFETDCSSKTKQSSMESKDHVIPRREIPSLWRLNPLAKEIHKQSANQDGEKKLPVTRLRKTARGRKGNGSMIINGKAKKSEKRVSRSNSENNSLFGMTTTGPGRVEKVENSVDVPKKGEQNICQSFGRQFPDIAKAQNNKSKGIPSEMVKMEDSNSDEALIGAAALVKIDESARVQSDVVVSTPDGPVRESTAKSPRPGDEAGGAKDRGCQAIEGQTANHTSEIACIEGNGIGIKGLPKALMIRKSVIESVKGGKTFGVNTERGYRNQNEPCVQLTLLDSNVTCQRNKPGSIDAAEGIDRLVIPPRESSGLVIKELNENRRRKVGDFRERRKKSEGQFGKLSELITDEQKGIIETLYTVNMNVVDDDEVSRSIKILDKMKVKCEICGKTYPRMDKCQVHVWGHLNMKPYLCKSCDFVTLTVSNIRCHIRKRHLKIKPFQCNLCEKSYGTAVLLEEHINSHTGAKPYKCKLCDFATSNRQVLSYHKTTHKPSKDISCEVCSKKFFSNSRMRAHMIVHNKDRSLMCKLCSTYLCNAEALEKHYQKVHSRDYVCNICGIRTRSRKALTNHENVHSEARYRCPICSNVYKSKHMLKEHLLKHQGIRKYKCELCHKSFAQQSHIAAHMSVHMGKRYPCPGCNKLFNRRDNMRIHTRRCKIFKSNPDTKNLRTNQDSTQLLERDGQSIAMTESTENSKTDTRGSETGLGLMRINLLTSKTDYPDSRELNATLRDSRDVNRDESFHKFKSGDREILRIGEVEIFPLSNPNVVGIQSEGNPVITENVLRPECF